MRVFRFLGGLALGFWLVVFLATQDSARIDVFAQEIARGKIWVSPIWTQDKIVREHLFVKFRSVKAREGVFRAWGLEQPKNALPAGWSTVSTQEAARALGMRLSMEKDRPSLETVKSLALRLAQNPDVEMVAFDYRVVQVFPEGEPILFEMEKGPGARPQTAVPTDPEYRKQWHFTPTNPKKGANAEGAWDITVGDPSIVVAVLDTGVTEGPDGFKHPFYMECDTIGGGHSCGPGVQTDHNRHGTHVAGTIAQESSFVTPGDDGLAGIAPNVTLFPIKVLDGGGDFADVAEGITLAAQNGAHVINMSLGAPCGTRTWEDGCRHPAVDAAIEDAVNNYDVVIVAAAGNDAQIVMAMPANHPLVIAVSATDQNSLAPYSNHGAGLSMSAPGGNISEDVDGDGRPDAIYQETHDGAFRWGFYGLQGTSMASPHVAGAAALLRSHNPAATWKQVRYCLESTAVDEAFLDDPAGFDARYGWGLLDIEAALHCIASPPPLPTQPNAHSSTASLGGLSLTTSQNVATDAIVYLSETQGVNLTWSLFFSENADCSTTDTISWLRLDPGQPASGTLRDYGTTSIDLDIDPSSTPIGTHTAYLCIRSNDPDSGPGNNTNLIPVPITVTIQRSLFAPDELQCNAPAVNFEAGIPGGWSAIDNEGGGVVWDVTGSGTCAGQGNYTNGSGKAACARSEAKPFTEFDTELRTNAFTIPASATGATLHYTANYQGLFDRLDLDISTDGGATWTRLLRWTGPHGGFYSTPGEDVTVDLSAYIGQTVILRWHYYDPGSGDYDFYAQIDDVSLDCPGAPSNQPNIDVNPASLSSTQDVNVTTTHTLRISNTGGGDLLWSTGEEGSWGTCSSLTDVPWLSSAPTSTLLAPGNHVDVTVTLDSAGLTPGTYRANLCFLNNDPDAGPGNGTDLVIVPVTLNVIGADLSVDKTVDDATPLLGQNVTFTVEVSNGGPSDATGVEVTDQLPAGLTYVSHTASQGTYNSSTGVWNVGTILAGGSATLQITAQVTATGSITNEAEVTAANEADPDSTPGDGAGDDYASVTLNASPAADLELRMTASNERPAPDETITVTVQVRNAPLAADAPNVQVRAYFGDGFRYIGHAVSQGSATVTLGSVDIDWNVGTIPAGGTATLTVQLQIREKPEDWQAWAEVVSMGIVDRDSAPGDGRGDDYGTLHFQVTLPPTGFPAGRETVLPPKPEGLEFAQTGLVLEIPRLGVKVPIVGVPSASWDAVAWLGNQVGYIQSTTFPTWRGNSVLTAHNYLPTGMPGPFVDLDELRWGDVVRIHYLGMVYEYEVRRVTRVDATDLWPFEYPGAGTWVTLITCTGEYDEASRLYSDRVVVRAVLMRIYPER